MAKNRAKIERRLFMITCVLFVAISICAPSATILTLSGVFLPSKLNGTVRVVL